MCDYRGYEFGAGRYPDSICIEGRLFDAAMAMRKGTYTNQPSRSHAPCVRQVSHVCIKLEGGTHDQRHKIKRIVIGREF